MTDFTISEATPDQIPLVAAACGRAFVKPRADYFERSMRLDPEADNAITLLAHVGDALVSTLRIFSRTIRWEGRTLRLGAIGNVATDPDHRGKGHAARLMQRAVEVMEERGFEISLLFTDTPRVYAKAGYEIWDQTEWVFEPTAASPITVAGFSARTVDWDTDVPTLLELQGAFNDPWSGTVVRTEAHWRLMPPMFPGDDAIALVASDSNGITTHVRAMKEGNSVIRIHEISGQDVGSVAMLIAGVAAQIAGTAEKLRLTVPPWSPIPEAVAAVFGETEPTPTMGGMWRALSRGPSQEEIMAKAKASQAHFWAGDRF